MIDGLSGFTAKTYSLVGQQEWLSFLKMTKLINLLHYLKDRDGDFSSYDLPIYEHNKVNQKLN